MTDLSPAAQAVLYAAIRSGPDLEPRIVAALRAAAAHLGSCNASTELIRIAIELEGQ
jgi:hypothetical protein